MGLPGALVREKNKFPLHRVISALFLALFFVGGGSSAYAASAPAHETPATHTPAASGTSGGHLTAFASIESDDQEISPFMRDAVSGRAGNAASTGSTGAFTYNYALPVPPGRNGMQPSLTLTNSDQEHSQGDVFGYGWSLSIPYIERENIQGLDTLYATSSVRFYSSLSGELATTSSANAYLAKSDDGSDIQYAFSNNTWVAIDKNGTAYTFGTTTAEREDDPSDSSRAFKWMLQSEKDTNGNTVTYSYFKDAGQIYPSSIAYTGNATSTGIFMVDFTHSLRATPAATTTDTGFPVQTRYKIDEITPKVNGTWVSKYDLAYTNGDNGTKLVLASITRSGQDENGVTSTLPANTFNYSTSTEQWTSAGWSIPQSPFVNDEQDDGVDFADVNGDGRTDLLQSFKVITPFSTIVSQGVYLATSTATTTGGWALDSSWTIPSACLFTEEDENAGNAQYDMGTRIVDVNGDLLPDLVCNSSVYLNNGHGWTLSGTWTNPEEIVDPTTNEDVGTRFMDLNGDGLPDIVRSYENNPNDGMITYTRHVYLNTGSGWATSTAWTIPAIFATLTQHDTGARVADLNGDGLDDIISGDDSSYGPADTTYLNTGSGFATSTSYTPPIGGGELDTRIADFNGDGLPDIAEASYNHVSFPFPIDSFAVNAVYLNTGSGWVLDPARKLPVPFMENGEDAGTRLGDFDGDGMLDFVTGGQGTEVQTWSRNSVYLGTGTPSDLLAHVHEETGSVLTPTYKASASYKDATGTLLNPSLPLDLITLQSLSTFDGISATTTKSYSYSGGLFYFNTPFDRRLAGFAMASTTDPAGYTTKTYYHQGTGTTTSTGEYSDDPSKIGKLYRTELFDTLGNLIEKIVNKWESFARGGLAYFVQQTRSTDFAYDGNTTHKEKSVTSSYDASNGNTLSQTQWGQVNGSDDGSFTDVGSDEFITNFAYASSTGDAVIGKLSQASTTDQSANKVSEKRLYYDTLSLGSIGLGNLTKEEDWIATSTYATTQHAYNAYGLVTQDTDPRDATTTYSYDPYTLYVATSTNALGQFNGYTYDYSSGAVEHHTDPNGLLFISTYDGFDRPTGGLEPDLTTPSTEDQKYAISYDTSAAVLTTTRTDYLDGSLSVPTITYFDGLSRPIQVRKKAEASGMYVVSDTGYDTRGNVDTQSLPYFGSGTTRTTATTTSALLTLSNYDGLNRLISFANIVGSTTYAYDDWAATTTDADSHRIGRYYDAYGNLAQVVEANGGALYTTNYVYDGNKDLTKLTDALGNMRDFTYDGLGRELTAEDLHAPSDTVFGTTTYAYDTAGNLIRTVTPRAKTITYAYDPLDRALTEDSSDTGFTDITYAYDTAPHYGKGKLSTVSTNFVGTAYDYDANGNLYAEQSVIPGSATTTNYYYYNRQGDLYAMLYPDSSEVQYVFNAAGFPEYIGELESGTSTWAYPVTNFDYAPTGQVSLTQFGNGSNQFNTYDPAHLYRLTSQMAVNASSTVYYQEAGYAYDPVGNITGINLLNPGLQSGKLATYTYDPLNRLTLASTTSAVNGQNYTQSFSYNPLGNLTSYNGTPYQYQGTSTGNSANPHAPTTIGTTTLTYDQDGNLLTSPSLTNTWNYRDRLRQSVALVGTHFATSTYTYDQDNERLSQTAGTLTTFYPSRYYSTDSTGKTDKYLYNGPTLISTIETVGTTTSSLYSYPDYQLSTDALSDSSGTLARTLDYYPYGSIRLNTGSASVNPKHLFLGQYYDSQPALSYLNARYYDGARGEFLSEDPVFLGDPKQQNLSNPQSLNSYSYGGDNPITNKDPSGRAFGVDDLAGIGLGGGIGAALYIGESFATGQHMTWGGAAGAFVSGGIVGWGAVNTPETLGASDAIAAAALYGGAGGFVGNGTKQVVDVSTNEQSGYNLGELGVSTAFGVAVGGITEGVLPDARIPNLSAGRGNMNAIGQAMQTKMANGTISSMSATTAFKSAVGSQAAGAYKTVGGILADIGRTLYSIQQQLNSQSTAGAQSNQKR